MATKVEILEDAKATIQKGWCQRDPAVDESGRTIPPWDSSACGCAPSVWNDVMERTQEDLDSSRQDFRRDGTRDEAS